MYEIFYIYEGKHYSIVEVKDDVINRIESLVSAGAVITDLIELY